MASKAVSDTGPLMHLAEIDLTKALGVFQEVYAAQEVINELKRNKAKEPVFRKVKLINLKPKFKDVAEILVNKFSIDLGESQSIALALQEKIDYFLTDDLEARTVAHVHGLEAHGTIGIILRALRERIIDKETAVKKVNELYTISSLFITKDLVEQVINSIHGFRNHK